MATLSLQLSADTHKGMRRSGNEDTFGIFDIPGCEAAFVVCDGMGGLHAGDIAANESVRVIEATLRELLVLAVDPAQALLEALRRANDAVNALAKPGPPPSEDPTVGGGGEAANAPVMGTTAVVGVVRSGTLYLAHAGDSRGYRFRDGALLRLTQDHSFVAEQVRLGNMTEAEARVSRFRNMITRAIGIDATIQPEVRQEALAAGDVILICSDGLTTMAEDDEIEAVLDVHSPLEKRVQGLIDLANRKGGHDNITVLLLAAGTGAGVTARPQEQRGGGVPSPERQRERETGEPAPRSARRRSAGPSPVLAMLALLGGIALLGLFALALSEDLRTNLGDRLLKSRPAVVTPTLNYAELVYDKTPQLFIDSPLARRAPLALLGDGSVAYVTSSEGQVVRVRGTSSRSVLVGDLKVPDNIQLPAQSPDDEVYVAGDPQGNTYVSLSRRGTIKKFSAEGKELTRLSNLDRPGAVAVDPKNGDVYFIDGTNHIQVVRAHPKPAAAPK